MQGRPCHYRSGRRPGPGPGLAARSAPGLSAPAGMHGRRSCSCWRLRPPSPPGWPAALPSDRAADDIKWHTKSSLLIGEGRSTCCRSDLLRTRLDTPSGICTTPSHRSLLPTCKPLQSGVVHLPRPPRSSIWGARLPFTGAWQRPCSNRGGSLDIPLPHHHRLPISNGHELLDYLDARIS